MRMRLAVRRFEKHKSMQESLVMTVIVVMMKTWTTSSSEQHAGLYRSCLQSLAGVSQSSQEKAP